MTDIMISGNQPTSGNVGSFTGLVSPAWTQMWDSRWIRVAGSFRSIFIFPLPFLLAAILNFGSRPMSGNVDSVIVKSVLVENVAAAVEIAS